MKKVVIAILALSLGVAGGVSLWASEAPDGLEHSLERVGTDAGGRPAIDSPMAGYEAPLGLPPWARKALAGVSGCLVVFGLVQLVGMLLGRRKKAKRCTTER